MVEPKYFKAYIDSKRKQDKLVKKRLVIGTPQVLDVSPGVVNTDMGNLFSSNKLDPKDIADIIYHAVSIKDKIAIKELVLDVPGLRGLS
jgi:NADP-dependent 3-hydroxy acid dehydrogenase YdfG